MMPHLRVLSSVNADAAQDVFERDCLVYLGTSICPVWKKLKPGTPVLNYQLEDPVNRNGTLKVGDLLRIPLEVGQEVVAELRPAHRSAIDDTRSLHRATSSAGSTSGRSLRRWAHASGTSTTHVTNRATNPNIHCLDIAYSPV